jgi:hypothetical protein
MSNSKTNSTSASNSTSRPMSKERWNSFMDTRWEELFTHPESPAMTEYQLLELEPLDGSRHISNFCWVPSLLYVITRRMGMLSHRSRRRVIEYFFHLLSGVIYALKLFEDGVVTQDDPCDVRIDEVYAYIWKEVSSQSKTSGKAGGLRYVNRSKRYLGEPPFGWRPNRPSGLVDLGVYRHSLDF